VFCIFWGTYTWGCKASITSTTFATFADNNFLSMSSYICNNNIIIDITNYTSNRYTNIDIFTIFTIKIFRFTIFPIWSFNYFLVSKIKSSFYTFSTRKDHTSTFTPITTKWTNKGNIFFTTKSNDSITTFTCFDNYFYIFNKHN